MLSQDMDRFKLFKEVYKKFEPDIIKYAHVA